MSVKHVKDCACDAKGRDPACYPQKWVHTGGGTAFNGSKYPCDDDYENTETGQRFTVFCTPERHLNMPERVSKPSDITRLVGVSHIEWPIH